MSLSQTSSPFRFALSVAFVLAISTAFACWVLGPLVNPFNTGWMTHDPVSSWFAWEAYRRDPAPAATLATTTTSWPLSMQIAMYDILPIISWPLKLLDPWMPAHYQWFGVFYALNAPLQGLFALLFFREIARGAAPDWRRDAAAVIGACLVAAAPVLFVRLQLGHGTIAQHWLIVAGLWLYARARRTSVAATFLSFGALLGLGGALNPYMLVMAAGIYCATLIRLALERRLGALSVLAALGPFAAAAGSLIFFGFFDPFGPGVQPGERYGYYSANLNSLVNPMRDLLGSTVLPELPVMFKGQYEGYGYLGLGALLIVGFGLGFARRKDKLYDSFGLPLLIVAGGAQILALSTIPTFGAAGFEIPTPAAVLRVLEIFRSSGRFIFVTHYILLMLGVAMLLRLLPARAALAALALGGAVQAADLGAAYAGMKSHFAALRSPRFADPLYADLGAAHEKLIVMPAWQCHDPIDDGGYDPVFWEPISLLATDNALATNSFYAGRLNLDQKRHHCEIFPKEFPQRPPEPKTAYLFTPLSFTASGARVAESRFCDFAEGFILCRADRPAGLSARAQQAIATAKAKAN